MKKYIQLLVIIVILLTFVGCKGKEKVDDHASVQKTVHNKAIKVFPDVNLDIGLYKDMVENYEDYVEFNKYYIYTNNDMDIEDEKYKEVMSRWEVEKSEDELEKIKENAKIINTLTTKLLYEEKESFVSNQLLVVVKDYINATRLKDDSGKLFLSKELEDENLVDKVRSYMDENRIKITEIIYPDTFAVRNYKVHPVKYTYRYTIKGEMNGEPFEEDVVQDFHVTFNIEQNSMHIAYISQSIEEIEE